MSDMQRAITILGATGSIGASTLDVVARHSDRFRVHALTAHTNTGLLIRQCLRFRPRYAVVGTPEGAARVREALHDKNCRTEVMTGPEALEQVASDPAADTVVAAIVGAAGLSATMAAVNSGKRVLLANKEALVMAGPLFMAAVGSSGAELLPLDSEHNAIFQCLPRNFSHAGLTDNGVRRVLLTASGGPFRDTPLEELRSVTPAQACAHPNWSMGRKISVDSATMMNKGLELIEACWLFDIPGSQVEVVLHPQSIIHSMVEYVDGSVVAQLGNPDMRTPIAFALDYPHRIDAGVEPLDLVRVGHLDFQRPDSTRFPCLRLAYEALKAGGSASVVLNAANEVAVAAFLESGLGFTDIPVVIEETLAGCASGSLRTMGDVLDADSEARRVARAALQRHAGGPG
ncbi:MAG: 1-deoxy-D-xylulose-5-phosphate reductoisomerase [Aquisalimonadaceae bacterium]